MTKEFKDLSSEEQVVLWKKLNAIIKEHELENKIKISFGGAYVGNLQAGQYQFQGGFSISGNLGLSESAKKDALVAAINEAKGDVNMQVSITCKIGLGDQIPEFPAITRVNLVGDKMEAASEDVTLKHNQGEVILLDLWATWCPPCQKPMAHNVEMLKKEKPAWKDKVRIIGLSIDQNVEQLCKLCVDRGYHEFVEHYHAANGRCQVNAQLGTGGVPHVALIDPTGVIVFKGHPSSIKLEEAIDDLCEKGESALCPKPSGGQAASGPVKKQADKPEKQMFGQEASDFINKFEEKVKALVADTDLVGKCAGMQRAFFVCEQATTYDEEKEDLGYSFTVHTLAIGNPASCAEGSKLLKEATQEIRDMSGIVCQSQFCD